MSLTTGAKRRAQGEPGRARMGNMPACEEADGRGGATENLRQAEMDKLDGARPGPARRVSAAYKANRKLNGALNAQGIKDSL